MYSEVYNTYWKAVVLSIKLMLDFISIMARSTGTHKNITTAGIVRMPPNK